MKLWHKTAKINKWSKIKQFCNKKQNSLLINVRTFYFIQTISVQL